MPTIANQHERESSRKDLRAARFTGTPGAQRMLRASPHLTPMHVMVLTNGFAFLAILAAIAATGEYQQSPPTLPWLQLVLYGGTSWIGVTCFMALTRLSGATAAVIATSLRKLLTIFLSFFLFPKPLKVRSQR